MSEPRFIVTEFAGYKIPERADGNDRRHVTTFYVQDTERQYEVVATFENPGLKWQRTLKVLRRRAEAECARLNAWHRALCDAE